MGLPSPIHDLSVCLVIGAAVACFTMLSQIDLKGLAAYRSIVHMGVATAALIT